ncbi:SAM-dependent methyltransferase [Allosalinactinospora lopnorensis]|uniref:SAM-dependent methyltransferase n=1 Tax=Allosalinactinospora lopnorensis TaxID=1352348 RepID=UPI000623BE58|nr:SAM-dependent methyltransferase [Allosalinactinospora lopnorensis]
MSDSSAVPNDSGPSPSPKIDTSVPQSARIWNYWLGGKDNYPVDRAAGDQVLEVYPEMANAARAARHFIARAVRYLAGEVGIRQFLDVGTGLPTVDNTHEIAQRAAPESKIVYVDNDPLVLAHARALLTSSPEGVTVYVDADLHDPATILREASQTLDLSRPTALMLMGILGHIDYEEALSIVPRLLDGLPSGSYLGTYDFIDTSQGVKEAERLYEESGTLPYRPRPIEQIAGFFEGLELVTPGVVEVTQWRPDPSPFTHTRVDVAGGVGRKP